MVYIVIGYAGFFSLHLCVRLANASARGVSDYEGRYSVVSLWRRAFVNRVIMRPSGACSRTSLLDVGCRVISYDSVGIEFRSGLMGWVFNEACLGYHPRDCGGGGGG